ncbi:MAG: UDP-N-acetylglucosamine 1-carboxyvinyltransferase [Candidatus Pacebacteria bacterium]|nr:UDP-N-acetylglucosamine 1-carboxyvinyltransferase [Candidatus Paceibacterota bacterium]
MDRIRIIGGKPLKGTVPISGAKNAALPLMCASLLVDEPLELTNVPDLVDIRTLGLLLEQHGVSVDRSAVGRMVLNGKGVHNTTAPYDLVRKMRASILVLGPLVARHGKAKVSLPGGCAIGARPVDLHIKGLQALGAEITLSDGYVHAEAPKGGLRGAKFTFPQVSVGATENLLLAASLAQGETQLINAAREPEIGNLAECLNAMGARITGIGSDCLTIQGVERLHSATHRIISDRIEAGTYAVAAAISGGCLTLTGLPDGILDSFFDHLIAAGVTVEQNPAAQSVTVTAGELHGVDVVTKPFPGFATDLQAQFMALMCLSQGASMITEAVFENRFMHVPELMRMGANISIQGGSALVRGVDDLTGAPVMATDLRASSSLVLAGLAAEGETVVSRVYHLDRGYEFIVEKLRNVGAMVERVA